MSLLSDDGMAYPIEHSLFDYSGLYLPVQALRDLSIQHVLNIEGVWDAANTEVNTNDLSKNILFLEENNGCLTPGVIIKKNGKYEIIISLTFCQFLWAVGLYISTVFDNVVQIPIMNAMGCNIHGYKANKAAVEFAGDSFFRARRLLEKQWRKEIFFEIPNICDPQAFRDEIGKANALMISGVGFIFAHELAHSYLGHTQTVSNADQMVKDEIAADELALDWLAETFGADDGYTNKVGIANLLCALLFMGPDSVSGGGSHPHMDIRIDLLMKRMDVPEIDVLWGYVGSALRLWLMVYGGYSIAEDMALKPFNFYKDFYDYYLARLRETRQRLFPEWVKPDWYVE